MNKIIKLLVAIPLVLLLSVLLITLVLRWHPISITPLMMLNSSNYKTPRAQRWVPLDSISPDVMRAVIACEDNNFLYHYGFDIDAIKEAMRRNERGRKVYGASTISQQTAKNVFLFPSRTWLRKGLEAGFTLLIETVWGKARIMEVYLNVIEMGNNIYGIEAASQYYFKKSAMKLTKEEATLIVIALPNPRKMNPAKPGSYMLNRKEEVYSLIEKTTQTGWYKNVKSLKQIPVNYLDN